MLYSTLIDAACALGMYSFNYFISAIMLGICLCIGDDISIILSKWQDCHLNKWQLGPSIWMREHNGDRAYGPLMKAPSFPLLWDCVSVATFPPRIQITSGAPLVRRFPHPAVVVPPERSSGVTATDSLCNTPCVHCTVWIFSARNWIWHLQECHF